MKAACVLVCLTLAHGITGSIFKHQERRVEGLGGQLEDIDQYQQQDQLSEGQTHQSRKYSNQRSIQKHHEQKPQGLDNQDESQIYQEQIQGQRYWDQSAQDLTSQEQKLRKLQQKYQDKVQKYKTKQHKYQTEQRESREQQQKSQEQQQSQEQYQRSQEQKQRTHKQQQSQEQYQRSQEQKQQSKEQYQQSQEQKQQSQEQQKRSQDQQQSQEQYQQSQEQSQQSHERRQRSQGSRHEQYQPSSHRVPHQHSQEEPTHKHHRHHEKTHHHSSSSESSQESKEGRSFENQQPTRNQKWMSGLYDSVMNKENQVSQAYGDAIVWRGLQMAVGPNAPVQDQEDIEKIFGDAQQAMKHIREEEKAKFHEVYGLAKEQENEDTQLNATQLAQKHQYPVEEHTIKTDDGYVLTVFRIPPRKQVRDVQKRPVVFLMHGILGSADDWLLMGPGKALAYLLSDAGYDVWLGNARGNKYSKNHVSKHPAMSDFWQYSTDEIALHDLPAMIDYALETTKQEKLYYIGHAQGTTAFFALTATRPEYNDKIIMMYALSPMVYMTNTRSPLFRMIAPTSKFQDRLQKQFGNGPFTPSKELIHTVGGAMLKNEIGCKEVSSNVNFVMSGINVEDLDPKLIPVVMAHLPAGTSTKVIKQYGQGVASHEFRRFDYGPHINKQVYGTQESPKYKVENVKAPVSLYYSEEDWLAHPKDVVRLEKELPNVRETYKVPEKHFSHMDFQFSKKAPEVVYQRLIDSMQNQQ